MHPKRTKRETEDLKEIDARRDRVAERCEEEELSRQTVLVLLDILREQTLARQLLVRLANPPIIVERGSGVDVQALNNLMPGDVVYKDPGESNADLFNRLCKERMAPSVLGAAFATGDLGRVQEILHEARSTQSAIGTIGLIDEVLAPKTLSLLQQFAGWLSTSIPELERVEVPRLAEALSGFLEASLTPFSEAVPCDPVPADIQRVADAQATERAAMRRQHPVSPVDAVLHVSVKQDPTDPNGNEWIGVVELHPPGCSTFAKDEAIRQAQRLIARRRTE